MWARYPGASVSLRWVTDFIDDINCVFRRTRKAEFSRDLSPRRDPSTSRDPTPSLPTTATPTRCRIRPTRPASSRRLTSCRWRLPRFPSMSSCARSTRSSSGPSPSNRAGARVFLCALQDNSSIRHPMWYSYQLCKRQWNMFLYHRCVEVLLSRFLLLLATCTI